jgi:hypothetical protein
MHLNLLFNYEYGTHPMQCLPICMHADPISLNVYGTYRNGTIQKDLVMFMLLDPIFTDLYCRYPNMMYPNLILFVKKSGKLLHFRQSSDVALFRS